MPSNFIAVGAEAISAGSGYTSTPTVAASGVDTVTPTLTAVINTVSVQASSTINGVGAVVLNDVNGAASSGTVMLDLDGSSSASAIDGAITDGTSGGSLALSKTNVSTWTLAGANTFTGGGDRKRRQCLRFCRQVPRPAPCRTAHVHQRQRHRAVGGQRHGGHGFGDKQCRILTSLSITGGGTLDIGNNRIIIDYSSPATDPIASIAAWIENGYL